MDKGRIIAIDFGLKRTGLAITDPSNIIASGLTTIDSKTLLTFLKELIPANNVKTIVLGFPKKLNNEDGHITENVRILKKVLEDTFSSCKIVLIDERFTSKIAFQTMIDSGLKKKDRRNKALIDEISATIILQDYMNTIH